MLTQLTTLNHNSLLQNLVTLGLLSRELYIQFVTETLIASFHCPSHLFSQVILFILDASTEAFSTAICTRHLQGVCYNHVDVMLMMIVFDLICLLCFVGSCNFLDDDIPVILNSNIAFIGNKVRPTKHQTIEVACTNVQ